ncbi:MAG: hypothetical protein GF347_00880 [Candidatus Moranbacteria bacterium]|nr:hypothetical protein [Candidatus Moranbacteria bacterium]
MIDKIKIGILVFITILILPVHFSKAVELNPSSCFDDYLYGNLGVDVTATKEGFSKGETIPLTFNLKNKSRKVIADVNFYLRVYSISDDGSEIMNIVDQFYLNKNLNILPKEEKKTNFLWEVPAEINSGNYRIAVYAQSFGKFNLNGLVFSDKQTAGEFDFKVTGGARDFGELEIDRKAVKVNGAVVKGETVLVDSGQSIKMTIPVKNNTLVSQNSLVKIRSYSSDVSLVENNLIEAQDEAVRLEKGESKELLYELKANDYPVNLISFIFNYGDLKSIVNVRIIKKGASFSDLNYVNLFNFPLKQGSKTGVKVCLSSLLINDFIYPEELLARENLAIKDKGVEKKNALLEEIYNKYAVQPGLGEEYNIELELRKAGAEGSSPTIERFEYNKQVDSGLIALESEYEPQEDNSNLLLDVWIKDSEGVVLDQASLNYDCEKLGEEYCSRGVLGSIGDKLKGAKGSYVYKALAILAGLVILLLIAGLIIKKRKQDKNTSVKLNSVDKKMKEAKKENKDQKEKKESGKINLLLAIIISVFSFFVYLNQAQAAVECNSSKNGATFDDIDDLLAPSNNFSDLCSGDGQFVTISESRGAWSWICGDEMVNPTEVKLCSANKETELLASNVCRAFVESQTVYPECGPIVAEVEALWPNNLACNGSDEVVQYRFEDNIHYWRCQDENGNLSEEECSVYNDQAGSCLAFLEDGGDQSLCNSECDGNYYSTEAAFYADADLFGLCEDEIEPVPSEPSLVLISETNLVEVYKWQWSCGDDDCEATLTRGPTDGELGCGPAAERGINNLEEFNSATDLCNNGKTAAELNSEGKVNIIKQGDNVIYQWTCDDTWKP